MKQREISESGILTKERTCSCLWNRRACALDRVNNVIKFTEKKKRNYLCWSNIKEERKREMHDS